MPHTQCQFTAVCRGASYDVTVKQGGNGEMLQNTPKHIKNIQKCQKQQQLQ